jgi:hypothetical protein
MVAMVVTVLSKVLLRLVAVVAVFMGMVDAMGRRVVVLVRLRLRGFFLGVVRLRGREIWVGLRASFPGQCLQSFIQAVVAVVFLLLVRMACLTRLRV